MVQYGDSKLTYPDNTDGETARTISAYPHSHDLMMQSQYYCSSQKQIPFGKGLQLNYPQGDWLRYEECLA